MSVPPPVSLSITDISQVGHARRAATDLIQTFGFDDVDAGNVAIIVSELASNLAKHAGGGMISLRPRLVEGVPDLEIVCVDSGPGIEDVSKCLEDGYSTSGTAGSGLGAVRRLSKFFDIYTQPGKGTVQVVRVAQRSATSESPSQLQIGGISVAIHGETECGDAWDCVRTPNYTRILVADGLGHGALAAMASREAVQVLHATAELPLSQALQDMHQALRATRGAAVAVADLCLEEQILRFAGVGNIAAFIAGPAGTRNQNLVSINGTLGCLSPKVKEFTYPLPRESTVVFYSDGLQSQVRLESYLGLAVRHPAVTAGVLYRDFQRGRDDATVVVAHVG